MASEPLRLLVKTNRGATGGRLSIAGSPTLRLKPLMESIEKPSGPALAASPVWHIATAAAELNPWDSCHALLQDGLGVSGGRVAMAEPDLEQEWLWTTPNRQAFGITSGCEAAQSSSDVYAVGETNLWYANEAHSQLEQARDLAMPSGNSTRIAHLDTGYDRDHLTKPKFLREDLARNFADDDRPNDATDRPTALINPMFGHGAGTLSILAGREVEDGMQGPGFIGGAGLFEIVPIRVANWVVLFRNSAIAQAFDYVHSLWDTPNRIHVVSMSMGGIASSAWADAVNALYERGIFVVTAAGNNFGGLPTRFTVYPARFNRVVAANGVMADGRPYADLPVRKMAGCYGPERKDATAMAGYTPNVPWAKFGCPGTIDWDGGGTSAATPQIAAAAALWIEKNKAVLDAYPEPWMRVEAVRRALFRSAQPPDSRQKGRVGHGVVRAMDALGIAPAIAAELAQTPEDSTSFPILRVLTGLGIAGNRQRMLELEALQISQQSREIEQILAGIGGPDSNVALSPQIGHTAEGRRLIEALIAHPSISRSLKSELLRAAPRNVSVPSTSAKPDGRPSEKPAERLAAPEVRASALDPAIADPPARKLWVYASDPLAGIDMASFDRSEAELSIPWEADLKPGPVGEYLEVVDVDPTSGQAYAPVNLNDPRLLARSGHKPAEGNPQFHQQMVYAVAMKTISHFEKALGRKARWAPRYGLVDGKKDSRFVRRLRIYPHALREENAYYSPQKSALLFGYFRGATDGDENLPSGLVFTCLSHDIIAHEVTHALLDGLHPRFKEGTNPDMAAFHEAFADIVALFQHFTMPEALRAAIREHKGRADLSADLASLAVQFGKATGHRGALRNAIKEKPKSTDYKSATESHARGAVLVSAVFAAFARVYNRKTQDLFRLATQGTGVLPEGQIPHDLANRLADEAASIADNILEICIRALDYCPPVDLTFGEYLRALITADRDLAPDDKHGYRVAFVSAFRERGIYPDDMPTLSVESLAWQRPEVPSAALTEAISTLVTNWRRVSDRKEAFLKWNEAARKLWLRLVGPEEDQAPISPEEFAALGLVKTDKSKTMVIDGEKGRVSAIEIHSIRLARRVSLEGNLLSDIVIEITQKWKPADAGGMSFRGGCTIICDLDTAEVRYLIRKRVGNRGRMKSERDFRLGFGEDAHAAAFGDGSAGNEPFAMLHRGT